MNYRVFAFAVFSSLAAAQTNPDPRLLQRWQWRNIGPATMGGRISDIAGVESDPNLIYLATGSAGLFKSTNGGTTWRAIFERQGSISIGGIAVDPHNPDIVWVGRLAIAAKENTSPPKPLYLRAPDAQPQAAARLPRR